MTIANNFLPLDAFKQVVENSPLFAIDLFVLNEQNQILVGQRLNAPAKGYWFVPGGRVYKNESLENAFMRISQDELGMTLERNQACQLGLYDHFYENSFFSENISTHYINATHVIRLSQQISTLPKSQHNNYLWLAIDEVDKDKRVHQYSKVCLPELKIWMSTFI